MPRPSKRFWVTAICYTILVILIKYLFSFFPTINQSENEAAVTNTSPFWAPRIVGVEIKSHLKYLDIGQLLVLFFQRGLLKVYLIPLNFRLQTC